MAVDQLKEYGLEQMFDSEIQTFLASQSTGVLGLPTGDVPYLVPLSYEFDGDATLYFTYLLGESSRKAVLTEQAERGRFLVFDVQTTFNWQSVLLTGDLVAIPEDEWSEIDSIVENIWQPDVLETASTAGEIAVYELQISEQVGLRQTGLAPGFQADSDS